MPTIASPAPAPAPWYARLPHEVWASVAISVMWLAVLFTSVFGPDLVVTNAGANTTSIPSGIIVTLFAYLGTRVVARHGFGTRGDAGS